VSAPSVTGKSPGKAPGMVFIMIAVLIDMMSIGLIIPVLAPLVGTFTHTQAEHTAAQLAVSFAFGLANFFGSPILGALSDRFGRRRVMLIGFSGLALSFFVTALANALWMLVVVRLFSGAMQANAAVATAYVADITAPEERAKRFGMLGATFGMGFILGPMLGGFLGDYDLHLPFLVAGSMAVCNWIYGYFVLPESLKPEHRRPFEWRKTNPLAALTRVRNLKGVGSLIYVIAFSGLAQMVLQSSWVLYTSYKFGWTPRDNGLAMFTVGLMSVVVQGGLLRVLNKRIPVRRLVPLGLLFSVLTNLIWGFSTEGWMMYAAIVIGLLSYAVGPTLQGQISSAADDRTQGETMGAISSLNSLMAVIAPVLGLGLMYLVSDLPKGDWRVGAPFYFCAVLQALSLVFARRHFSHAAAAQAVPGHAVADAH